MGKTWIARYISNNNYAARTHKNDIPVKEEAATVDENNKCHNSLISLMDTISQY